jgi:hypothetical protein
VKITVALTTERFFRPQRENVRKERRKLHDEELNTFCSSPNIITSMK